MEKYAEIVKLLASFSKDTRLKVGACILKNDRIISTGYNGQLPGHAHIPVVVDGHDVSTIHAEQNCLMHCAKEGISTDGCFIIVSHFPCIHCTKMLIMAGIKKVYYLENYRNEDNPYISYIEHERI